MIFTIFPRVLVKLGDERYIFDQPKLMFPEVAELEKATGLSYGEWVQGLQRYSITSIAALVHILRRRDGVPSDFATMNFAAADLDVVPLHDDDSEYTAEEVAAELARRLAEARAPSNGAGPTLAAAGPEAPSGEDASMPRQPTSPSSPPATASGPGSGTGSRTRTGSSSKRTRTPS